MNRCSLEGTSPMTSYKMKAKLRLNSLNIITTDSILQPLLLLFISWLVILFTLYAQVNFPEKWYFLILCVQVHWFWILFFFFLIFFFLNKTIKQNFCGFYFFLYICLILSAFFTLKMLSHNVHGAFKVKLL